MRNPFLAILKAGIQTQEQLFLDLPPEASGLPAVADTPCSGCGQCARVCPTQAITLERDARGMVVQLDRGRCLGCSECLECCPTQTLVVDRSTRIAVRTREECVISNRPASLAPASVTQPIFRHSLHIREVSTGDNAADLEVIASTNAIFDIARFGVHFVASPRFADALLVTGPVGRGMRDALQRCYSAMADPRLVIAAGTSAISGGMHRGGYAEANGITDLPVAAYIPGAPPIHGASSTAFFSPWDREWVNRQVDIL